MLRFLSIRHLAVIDRIELEFGPGLTVLTGETGAGKSILMGAVGLLVGGRASAELVRTGEESASIEAIFDTPGRPRSHRPAGSLRAGTQPRVRRRRARHERRAARALRPARRPARPARTPGAARSRDPTSMCSTRTPVSSRNARTSPTRSPRGRRSSRARPPARAASGRVRRAPSSWRSSWPRSIASARSPAKTTSWPRRGRSSPTPTSCSVSAPTRTRRLYEGDQAALASLGVVWRKVGELAAIDERFAPHLAARDAVKPALEDLAYFLRSYSADIDASPARLQEVEDRLAALERLKKKHGPTLAEVIAKSDQLRRELDMRRARLRAIRRARPSRWRARAQATSTCSEQLSATRQSAAPVFSRTLEKSLGELAMARTRCEVRFTAAQSEAEWTERGRRAGRVLHLAESGRGPEAAGADRVGRRALADHARAQDARLERRPGKDAHLR